MGGVRPDQENCFGDCSNTQNNHATISIRKQTWKTLASGFRKTPIFCAKYEDAATPTIIITFPKIPSPIFSVDASSAKAAEADG